MSTTKVSIAKIVIVRDRSKPVGAQVVPAIVTAVHDESGNISATGFPPDGSTFNFPSLSEIESAKDDALGWYWPAKV